MSHSSFSFFLSLFVSLSLTFSLCLSFTSSLSISLFLSLSLVFTLSLYLFLSFFHSLLFSLSLSLFLSLSLSFSFSCTPKTLYIYYADIDTLFETEFTEMCDSLSLWISDYSIFGRSSGQYISERSSKYYLMAES